VFNLMTDICLEPDMWRLDCPDILLKAVVFHEL
jgi:hypothetical protein